MSNLTKMLGLAAVLAVVLAIVLFLTQSANAPTITELEPDEALTELDGADTELDSLDSELEQLDADASGL